MGHNKHTGKHMKSSPAQLANLRNFRDMDPEEHRELSRRGGRAVQRVYDRRESFKTTAEWLLSQPSFATSNDAVEAIKQKFPDLNNQEAMTVAVIAETIRTGDSKGLTAIRDTVGESPTQNLSLQNQEPLTINIKTVD